MADAWRGFVKDGHWDVDVNVRNFIQRNYTQYDGDESFLEGATEATDKLWGRLQELQKEERSHGIFRYRFSEGKQEGFFCDRPF